MTGEQLYEMWAGVYANDVEFGVWDDLTTDNRERWVTLARRFDLQAELDLVQEDVDAAAQEWGLGDESSAQEALDKIRRALGADR